MFCINTEGYQDYMTITVMVNTTIETGSFKPYQYVYVTASTIKNK